MAARVCKDCVADWADEQRLHLRWENTTEPTGPKLLTAYLYDVGPSRQRPAPYPGPRCATHDREVRRARKAKNHGKYVQRQYGLGEHDYGYLYEAQNGTCAICERATGATRRLSVDHDHKCCNGPVSCGACVRGLLCRPCNDLLGHCRDDWRMLARAIRYLQNPPGGEVLRKRRSGT